MCEKKLKRGIKIFAKIVSVSFIGMGIIAKLRKGNSVYDNEPEQKNPLVGKKVVFVNDEDDRENADGVKGHLEAIGENKYNPKFYDKYIKRILDIIFSGLGLIILFPVYVMIALAIKFEDAGPVFFTQKRIGQNKQYFKLHKFRTMKISTPHDIPTHMLTNPELYITKIGKFLRVHSLDELPQIWDIFIGNMSIIGPRPGLWNQDILTAERDKYSANNVKPGLTGWAQINGRDELAIPVKAKLDGEYVKKISLKMDIKCFLKSISVFAHDNSIVEGGTGRMKKTGRFYTDNKSDAELIGQIGFSEPVIVNTTIVKKVLITGADSYIGETFRTYAAEKYTDNFIIDTVDMVNTNWRDKDFSNYDIVYHVAGIAHADVGNIDDKRREKYYEVNTDLALEVCRIAKESGVKEFIFMSSAIIYRNSVAYGKEKIITKETVPVPANFYGDSKLQADVAVRELADENFTVIVLRPPMIYGKDSKGNYQILSKLSKKIPIFPNINNQRSVLFIDNLCELLCQIMLVDSYDQAVVLIPQNREWVKTIDIVEEIGKVNGNKIRKSNILKLAVLVGKKMPGKISEVINKAFGNMVYDQSISTYIGIDYQKINLKDSILKAENKSSHTKKILFLVNHDIVIYNFRLEIVERFIEEGYEVHVSSPYGDRIDDLMVLGVIYHEIKINRHGMNLKDEIKILFAYDSLFKRVKPDIILGYTIKPNIYGALVAQKMGIPFVANITGLGIAVEKSGVKQKVFVELYRIAFRKVQRVFFQNDENRQFFEDNNIAADKHAMLPGSGVNLERFSVSEYPDDKIVKFLFISRIMKEKGIDQYIDAAKAIKNRYPNVEFHICGFCEDEYEVRLDKLNADGTIIYHGMICDVAKFMKNMHCVIHPTYYPEGLSNVLLEACASGRPIISTDRSGCREVVDDGVNGYMIPQKNSSELIRAIKKFMTLSYEEKKEMGINARKKVEQQFDRKIVVEAYMREVKKQDR